MQKVQSEDSILIERFQRGDKQAFDTLVQKHQARAYQYAFRLTRNPDDAADVVADAFVRVYRALQTFKGDSAFTTWLYRIETNCFLDMRKKKNARPTTSLDSALNLGDGEVELQVEDHSPTAQDEAERSQRMSAVEEAVQRLPEYQRAMIIMYHAESMSYEEIADSLNLPIGTVKSRLNRARLSLRQLLEPQHEMFALAS
ncbi:MAG TPA: sigma-70 family RNA polymerase sigma factor [Fimbriimonas sp.]|nr:sigma-70 family RNA polymerase sigma factor [Fimbriimonas sp.]